MEQREVNAEAKARRLIGLMGHKFFRISSTIHPSDLKGEAPGKSSNEAWAGKRIIEDYSAEKNHQSVIVTTMDGGYRNYHE